MTTTTYLPSVHNQPTVSGESGPDKARQVFERMRAHEQQGRKEVVWNELLAKVAAAKCMDMAVRGYTGHVNPDGMGPNKMVRAWGYKLPGWYSQEDDANNIESLCHNGDGSVEGVWRSWMASEGHRVHVLGLNDFYAQQTNVGIGYYEGGEKRFYWCVLTCPPEEGRG